MEANSQVTFNEAQVALARQWIGDQSDADGTSPITDILVREPVTTGEVVTKTAEPEGTRGVKVKIPASDEEARSIVERFEHGADDIRGDEDVADTVAQHMLTDKTGLLDEKWLGTEEEERDA